MVDTMLSPYQKANLAKKAPSGWGGTARPPISHKGDILRVFEKYTGKRPKKVGSVWMGHCPYHEEKTPSFSLYEKDSSFRCYGCGKYGDSLDLIQHFEDCDFTKAKEIAKRL